MNNNIKKNTIWNTIGVTFNSFSSLFFLVIINRINGIEIGGVFSYSYSLACLFFIVGVYATRTFQVADVEKKLNDLEYLISKVLTCGLMIIVCTIFLFTVDNTLKKEAILIFSVFKMLEAFSDTLYGYMQKKDKLYLAGISMTLKTIASLFIFFFVDYITKNFIISGIFILIISLLVTIFFDLKKGLECLDKEEIQISKVFKIFSYGFPIFIISFLSVYIANSQKYVINDFLDDSSQTIFSIIVMPATAISLCGQYIMNPVINELVLLFKEHKNIEFNKRISSIIKLLILFWGAAEIGAFIFGIPFLNILYSIDLTEYKFSLLLILFGALFYAISVIFQNSLIIMEKNRLQIVIYLISSLISFISSLFFISIYGVYGATISYVLSMILHCVMYTVYYKYEYRKLNR